MKGPLMLLVIALFTFTVNAQRQLVPPAGEHAPFHDPFISAPETPPMFPGGYKSYIKFLQKNLKWPNQDDAQGRVIVSFYVEKDGRLTNIKVEKSLGSDFDAEALRVINKSPKWLPGTQNRKPVRVKFAVPINFAIAE